MAVTRAGTLAQAPRLEAQAAITVAALAVVLRPLRTTTAILAQTAAQAVAAAATLTTWVAMEERAPLRSFGPKPATALRLARGQVAEAQVQVAWVVAARRAGMGRAGARRGVVLGPQVALVLKA